MTRYVPPKRESTFNTFSPYYFYKVSKYDKGMDICSGEGIDKSGPKYQHEGESKFYFRYLEIERLDYSDLC